ncbi:MAG TPA: CBS domain-containing protein [Candidatus Limnocylindria bacterium]|nr:CBS domain-containing protein [Candidatus Limnocylindria bacterium]
MSDSPISSTTSALDIARLVGGTEAIVVRTDDPLHALAERAVANPSCRVLSVVDGHDRLVGLVRVTDLLEDIFLKVVPEESLGAIDDVEDALRYARHLGARTAADVMQEPAWVHADDDLRTVFHRLRMSGLNGLPVTDAERRVVAYLDQLELLMAWVETTGREVLLAPQDKASPDEPTA